MLMTRLYERNAKGRMRIAGVKLVHTGHTPEQNFKVEFVARMEALGLMTVGNGSLTLHAEQEDVHYTVHKSPGRYCCHCGAKLIDDATGAAAREHVKAEHEGKKSPDEQNPSGYRMANTYECVIDADQHKRFSAKPRLAAKGKR
jgi:hypothetical protein